MGGKKNYLISRSFWPGQSKPDQTRPGEWRQQKVQKWRAKCKLNEIFMQRFLDVLQQPKLATFGAKSNANASLDVLLNWKSHYHLDAFFECILSRTRGESPRLERRDSKSKSKLESKMELELEMESKALGIVWYSQLIIVIIANLQIDMKLISAPVERGDEAVLQAGREETTSWSAASPRRQQFEKLVFLFFCFHPARYPLQWHEGRVY